ncbi:putative aarF domain-containing protein kinase 5 isoform X2 [Lycorma delicatula]|uniref:putative aarF domain-containing protein kinase 5 isoform X2 n=1 Tax=Lycorma delicatula TaxID=130591 RepID=UPI003F5153F3
MTGDVKKDSLAIEETNLVKSENLKVENEVRILTTEFVNGIKINDKDELLKNGFSLADNDLKLFRTFAEQIFHTGFVHADPHAGNVLVRKDKYNKAQFIILDHGLYETVPANVRKSLCSLWKSIILNNHCDMKKYSLELGVADYQMMAELLTQSPLRSNCWQLNVKLTREELMYLSKAAENHFDHVTSVLKRMPTYLIFVIRYVKIRSS